MATPGGAGRQSCRAARSRPGGIGAARPEQGEERRPPQVMYSRIPTMPITSSAMPITDSGGFRSPWRRAEVHRGAGVGLRVAGDEV